MGQRNAQHHGKSEGDDRAIPGRDVPGSEQPPRSETSTKTEGTEATSRGSGSHEGADHDERRTPRSGPSHGRAKRGKDL